MKKMILFLLLAVFTLPNPGCSVDEECLADLTVTALDAPAAVLSGNVISVICVIKNVISVAKSCGPSGSSKMRIECAYSSEFRDKFSDYEVFDTRAGTSPSLEPGEAQPDPVIMEMPTNYGPGYYAMRVTTLSEIDENTENNSRAIVIKAD